MYAILEPKLGRDVTRLTGEYNSPDLINGVGGYLKPQINWDIKS